VRRESRANRRQLCSGNRHAEKNLLKSGRTDRRPYEQIG
jgi:hypothetical protein